MVELLHVPQTRDYDGAAVKIIDTQGHKAYLVMPGWFNSLISVGA